MSPKYNPRIKDIVNIQLLYNLLSGSFLDYIWETLPSLGLNSGNVAQFGSPQRQHLDLPVIFDPTCLTLTGL